MQLPALRIEPQLVLMKTLENVTDIFHNLAPAGFARPKADVFTAGACNALLLLLRSEMKMLREGRSGAHYFV